MKTAFLTLGFATAGFLASSALATANPVTTLPIDTGYNNGIFAPYALPTGPPSNVQDNYWINIATYPTLPVAPAWVYRSSWVFGGAWAAPIGLSNWIGPRSSPFSAPGITASNPGYSIYRKCFCLAANFNSPDIRFQVMNDEGVEIWLNSITNILYGPVGANYTTPSAQIVATPTQLRSLRTGTNCIYVEVEDTGGATGFDLSGTFAANGLYMYAAAGVDQTYPCPCSAGKGQGVIAARQLQTATASAIIKSAEARRRAVKNRAAPR